MCLIGASFFRVRPASANAVLVSASRPWSCRAAAPGLARGEPAGGAGGDDLRPGFVFLGKRDVARRQRQARQLAATGVADRG